MKTLIRIVVFLAVALAVLVGVSYLFKSDYRVERSVEISAPATTVFAFVADLRQWNSWTPWAATDPEMKMTYSDVSVGPGAWQKWDGPKAGKGELKFTSVEPGSRVVYELYFPDFDMRSIGEIVLTPTMGGVKVVWSDAGNLGMNPVNRWVGLFLDKLVGGDFEKGLAELKKRSEAQSASPK